MESIKQFGFVQPIVVDKDNVVIIGHCRLIAAKRLKMREVDCVRAENLTQEQVDKLRLLDNKLNESDWDFDLLLEDIPELDFSDFDIDWGLPEVENPAEKIIEDEPPELPEVAKAMLGDIFEIGGYIGLSVETPPTRQLSSVLWMVLKLIYYLLTHLITWTM